MRKEDGAMVVGQLIGRGNTAEVYDVKDKEQRVIKLFYENIPFESIEKEYEISRLINQLGISSPKAYEVINIGNKWGIIYEKIVGNPFTQILSSQPFSLRKNAKEFAKLHASFHEKYTEKLTDQKKFVSRNITRTNLLDEKEKAAILNYLKHLPEGNKVCHGDYHTDNIIVMEGKPIVLDWMTGTSGNPSGDVARTMMILKYSSLPKDMQKLTKIMIQFVRKAFASAYLKEYIKITNTTEESITRWLLPIMAARLVEDVPEQEKQFLLREVRTLLAKNK